MHPILGRQLRQTGDIGDLKEDPRLARLLDLIGKTYEELENDRRFAESALRTVSDELFEANETIRIETERQLASQSAQLAMALQSTGDGLWSWDARSGRLELSPAWVASLGYAPGELPQDLSAWAKLIHPDDWDTGQAALQQTLNTDEVFTREMKILSRSGQLLWFLMRGRAVERDASGTALRLVGTAMNITAQKRIEEDLRAAKQNAELANEAKSRFLAIMSHEIRTPMNGVLGFADLLGATPLDAVQQEYLSMITVTGKTLIAIINDILDFSRAETGLFDMASEDFSPSEAVSEICSLLGPQAEAKGVKLEASVSGAPVGHMVGDSLRFRQILLNLISNAIKFTESGSIGVSTRLECDAEGPSWLILEVRDTGVGIPENDLLTIFEPFAQADMSVTRKYQGTGLGLAIAKRMTELMGGTISVRSEVGKGSVFHVKLPHQEGVIPPPQEASPRDAGAPGIPLAIRTLLVEDNRINRLLATKFLQALGCEVLVAEDGSQAVEMVSNDKFDVIFMDMNMPVMDGLTATRIIRETRDRDTLPIIAISANALESDRVLCLQAGMNGFIAKPFVKSTLLQALSEVLSESGIK